jgi:hypothetical protein
LKPAGTKGRVRARRSAAGSADEPLQRQLTV